MKVIKPRSGTAFILKKDQYLLVEDLEGQQVSDMVCFAGKEYKEKISSGKTLDFEATTNLTTGNFIWSNRSRKLLQIVHDDAKKHDFILAPCSKETFKILYKDHDTTHSCLDNLTQALKPYGITKDDIPTAFNIFMNVQIKDTKIAVLPPQSLKGDRIVFKCLETCLVALTACSAKDSNGGTFKPIGYQVLENF
ncbi:DUF1989 domain-containing protein [Winogradskyella ouciana]|uniref:DUF1989 domain-containing protein n=1 Tax=Winogradskyella ouciana TaxID=2608631 RepID=A0A7K1GAY0_9FLAO|nr:urea carboxylase-associated family protein [Winogradskyella ouciana]MTE26460.1 DUF1989 domain-containing protein [Winogradskyella ouciana]